MAIRKRQRRRYPRSLPAANPLTPDLRERFDSLLLTWPLRQVQGKVSIPAKAGSEGPAWQLEYEEKYGDGHYADRRALLDETRNRLEMRGLRPEMVCASLERAKATKMQEHITGRRIDWQREYMTELKRIVPNVQKWATRMQDLFDRIGYADPDRWEEKKLPDLVTYLNAFLVAMEDDSLLKISLPGPFRRPAGPGRQPEPWLEQARRELVEAGISSKQDREDLFMAVGLTPWRNP
jgi:hypothetical protein